MTNNQRMRDACTLQRRAHNTGLTRRRGSIIGINTGAPAVARPVNGKYPEAARGKPVAQRAHQICLIAAGTMQQHDGAARVPNGVALRVMWMSAISRFDPHALRRKPRFNASRLPLRPAKQTGDDDDKNGQQR